MCLNSCPNNQSINCLSLLAGKLGAPVEVVQHGVEGLMYLMTESSKCMVLTVCVCLCVCMFMHILYIYVFSYICISIYVLYMHVYVCGFGYLYVDTYLCIYVDVDIKWIFVLRFLKWISWTPCWF